MTQWGTRVRCLCLLKTLAHKAVALLLAFTITQPSDDIMMTDLHVVRTTAQHVLSMLRQQLTDRQAPGCSHAHNAAARKDRHPLRHSGGIVAVASHDEADIYVLLVLEIPQLAIDTLQGIMYNCHRVLPHAAGVGLKIP